MKVRKPRAKWYSGRNATFDLDWCALVQVNVPHCSCIYLNSRRGSIYVFSVVPDEVNINRRYISLPRRDHDCNGCIFPSPIVHVVEPRLHSDQHGTSV